MIAEQTSIEEIRAFEHMLLGEVRILGALRNHKHIVHIYGHQLSCKWLPAEDGNKDHRLLQSMIIMEHVNGGSLKVELGVECLLLSCICKARLTPDCVFCRVI